MNFKIFLSLLFSFISMNMIAQIITDRPDQTESSSTIPAGSLQLESGFLISYEGEGINSTRQILAPTTLFRYGITNGIELRLLSQFENIKNDPLSFSGISDLEIGVKVQIFKKESSNVEVAFLSHLLIPRGSKELTNEDYATINKLSISHSLSETTGLGYNIGYNYFGSESGDLTYSVALGNSVDEKLGIYIEAYGEFRNMDEFILNSDAGITYLLNPNLQLDFSIGTGINQRMNYLSFGFSWLIPKKSK